MRAVIGRRLLDLQLGDITELEVDAIVNAANSRLMGGGGVDGAIHDAAGPGLMAECEKLGRCPTGSAVATSAGRLRAKWVFHAVGPVWDDGNSGEPTQLDSAYSTCMDLALERSCRTIAFPAISTGVFGYPMAAAADVALRTVGTRLIGETTVQVATFVLYDRRALASFTAVLQAMSAEHGWPVE